MNIAQLFGGIPDVIWSGIIASLLTLGGVLISNRSNTTRLKTQLTHDREEKARERTISLRREAYLKATEELVKLNAFLVSLPHQDMAKGSAREEFVNFQAALTRLQLVAEPKTTLLAMRLSTTYGELLLDFMQQLMTLSKTKADIQIADDLYTKSNNEVQRLLSAMAQHAETGKQDVAAFDALQRHYDFNQKQASKLAAARAKGWDEFNRGNIEFMRGFFARLREIAPQQMELMVEIRRDLALAGDLSEVEEEMRKNLRRMEVRMEQFFHTLNSSLSEEKP